PGDFDSLLHPRNLFLAKGVPKLANLGIFALASRWVGELISVKTSETTAFGRGHSTGRRNCTAPLSFVPVTPGRMMASPRLTKNVWDLSAIRVYDACSSRCTCGVRSWEG